MTATSIGPLRKRDLKGELYTRLPGIEAKLVEISLLTRTTIAARCAIQDKTSSEYLPTECLVYLVRDHRSRPFDDCSEVLFKTLMERVLHGLPPAVNWDGGREQLTAGNVRDEARHRFLAMLAKDRGEYVEALDIYEIRFQKALATLRTDAERKVYRVADRLQSIEVDPETGEIGEEVERAAGMFDPLDRNPLDDLDYRRRLDRAIDALPELQKAIIELLRKGLPIESKEAGVVNISDLLEKTSKTIRTHRDMAYATLRRALTKGEPT